MNLKVVWKPVIGGIVILLVLASGISWVLGKNVTPWVATAKLSAREKLEKMVDHSKYELAKAEHAIVQARERVEQIRKVSAQANAGVRQLENERKVAEKEMQMAKFQLAMIGGRLETGQEVRLASGRTLTLEEIRLRVQEQAQRIELAQHKMALLDDVINRRQERRQKLLELSRQAPLELGRLELSVHHLAEKIKLYETQQALYQEEQDASASLAGLFENAQQTLEIAHADLDAKLAGFDALFGSRLDVAPLAVKNEDHQSQQIIGDIRKLLSNDGAGLE